MSREQIFKDIEKERNYQDQRWGNEFDDLNTANDWAAYIMSYAGRAVTFVWNKEQFKATLLITAALCVAALETLERNNDQIPKRHYD